MHVTLKYVQFGQLIVQRLRYNGHVFSFIGTVDLSQNTMGRRNKPPTRRLLQPVVIRPNIYRPTQPGVGQNDGETSINHAILVSYI